MGKNLFLFDMDGTLTPARQKMPIANEVMLGRIQFSKHEVGIITGSDMNYVKQQCSSLFDLSLINTNEIHFLPCNGTKYIKDNELIYSENMKEYVGSNNWNNIIEFLFKLQLELISENKVIPLSGHFFDYRESLLNWCPIGRKATLEDRTKWESVDLDNAIRNPILVKIKEFLSNIERDITVKLGGDTSFDIFPTGWDKTYPLDKTELFKGYDKIYFVGDRCTPNGNDYELYKHPAVSGFQTSSPEETIEIVNKILSEDV